MQGQVAVFATSQSPAGRSDPLGPKVKNNALKFNFVCFLLKINVVVTVVH